MKTKVFKVYGRDGHKQQESFNYSYQWDCSNLLVGVRKVKVMNYDMTGSHAYTLVEITRNTDEEIYRELEGQLNNGIFEKSNVGKVVEVEHYIVRSFND